MKINRLNYIKDTVGNNYLGIKIPQTIVQPFLDRLKNIIGVEDYDIYVKNQQNRDHGSHHITVINVMDYNNLSKEFGIDKFVSSLDAAFDYNIDDLKLMGVGKAEKSGNCAYFIVVNSEKSDAIRTRYNLPKQDFHITIGFKYKDVFGVRKNEVIKEHEPFLKILKKYYYDYNERFEFIKEIDGFDLDTEKEIEPIKIESTYATFRIDNVYFNVSLIDDNFRITAQWDGSEKKPILANTLIAKKFKEI